MKCPHCKASPLEVYCHIDKYAEGTIDNRYNLYHLETDSETLEGVFCRECDHELPEGFVRDWS